MRENMFVLVILIVETTTAFEFKCPAQAEWGLRARYFCSSEDKYVCLFHLLQQKYQDNCLGSDRSSIGSKLVFQPLFNLAQCNAGRFQPIVFTTHGNSACILLQSKCDEEGQIVYSNGSYSNDTTCRCDYTKGYVFVISPKNICFCIPSEEDCSCFKVTCKNLSPDYQCITSKEKKQTTKCQDIHPQISYNYDNRHSFYVHRIYSDKKRHSNAQVTRIIIAVAAGLIIVTMIVYKFGISMWRSQSQSLFGIFASESFNCCGHSLQFINFQQPEADSVAYLNILEQQFVSLEKLGIRNYKVFGTVNVKNISFEKKVFLRVTFDKWVTPVEDCICTFEYSKPSASDDIDTFAFEFDVPGKKRNSQIEFAIGFEANAQKYWDNRNGENYKIYIKGYF